MNPGHVTIACQSYTACSQSTRYRRASAMRWVLRYLKDCGAPDLAKHVTKVPIPSPRDVTISTEAQKRILQTARPHLALWAMICSDLALRSGTAAKLAPQNYSRERKEVSIPTKGGRLIVLPVTEQLALLFEALNLDTAMPFVTQLHPRQKITVQSLRVAWKVLLEKQGLPRNLHPHDLRRTTAVKAYEATKDVRVVQALLGHEHLATTLHYLDHRKHQVPRTLLEALATKGGVQ